jgi:hypothetical protein
MAGSSSNWFRPSGGPYAGQAVYLSKQERGGLSRKEITDALETDVRSSLAPAVARVASFANSSRPAAAAKSGGAASPPPPAAPAKRRRKSQTGTKTSKTSKASTGASDSKTMPDLTVVKSLGGGSGANATLVQDKSGKQYVRKQVGGSQADRLREEALADQAYAALGVPTPTVKLYTQPDGSVTKLAGFVANSQTLGSLGGKERAKAEKQVRENFVADALLGNWDVAGSGKINIVVANGTPYRIDNGGSMRYRAQGAPKTSQQWSPIPTELFSMRRGQTSGAGREANSIYNKVGMFDIARQARDVYARRGEVSKTLRGSQSHDMVMQRMDTLKYVADTVDRLKAAGHAEDRVDRYMERVLTSAVQSGTLPSVDDSVRDFR